MVVFLSLCPSLISFVLDRSSESDTPGQLNIAFCDHTQGGCAYCTLRTQPQLLYVAIRCNARDEINACLCVCVCIPVPAHRMCQSAKPSARRECIVHTSIKTSKRKPWSVYGVCVLNGDMFTAKQLQLHQTTIDRLCARPSNRFRSDAARRGDTTQRPPPDQRGVFCVTPILCARPDAINYRRPGRHIYKRHCAKGKLPLILTKNAHKCVVTPAPGLINALAVRAVFVMLGRWAVATFTMICTRRDPLTLAIYGWATCTRREIEFKNMQ